MATIQELEEEIARLKREVNRSALTPDDKATRAIRYYSRWAAGAGLLSPPILDLAAVTAVQLRLVKNLANIYGKNFDDESGKSLVAALTGALAPAFVGQSGAKLLLRAFGPGFIGAVTAGATIPALNYGTTTLVGKFFQTHFQKAGDEPINFQALSEAVAGSLGGRSKAGTAAPAPAPAV